MAVIAVLASLGKCSHTASSNAAAPMNSVSDTLANSISAQDLPPVQPLSKAAVRRGIGHYRVAFTAEGLSGAMIYSQNCYDALARTFSWAKVDSCGAFDMMTIKSMPEEDQPDLSKEISYFDEETAAGRYLKAVTSAGETTDGADKRLSDLQASVAKVPVPKPTATPAEVVGASDGVMDNGADDSEE
ncbi:hypothetical protein FPZ24_01910 [Sphingomonas panacisoli]|uniref:Uncharacterized protein n=1 Tax=Sphingomonas panacisoli TaxID=1813879 RepID=A0A5B8LEP9_9SPHN|nr:hypothetical protein [Sphingomonas panacisoli]QDZ06379.1 hypothetical protein FPZ24_01910 [Sphingomonas panacisoli]